MALSVAARTEDFDVPTHIISRSRKRQCERKWSSAGVPPAFCNLCRPEIEPARCRRYEELNRFAIGGREAHNSVRGVMWLPSSRDRQCAGISPECRLETSFSTRP